jgi:hypothetical protein
MAMPNEARASCSLRASLSFKGRPRMRVTAIVFLVALLAPVRVSAARNLDSTGPIACWKAHELGGTRNTPTRHDKVALTVVTIANDRAI